VVERLLRKRKALSFRLPSFSCVLLDWFLFAFLLALFGFATTPQVAWVGLELLILPASLKALSHFVLTFSEPCSLKAISLSVFMVILKLLSETCLKWLSLCYYRNNVTKIHFPGRL